MTTGILVAVTIVLVLAAAFVGVLLVRRRPRPAPPTEAAPPQTVGELVRLRSGPPDDLSGDQLFTPAKPWQLDAAVAAPPTDASRPEPDADAEARTVEVPVPHPATATPPPPAPRAPPWRRAARMRGEEPGAGWDTAPLPVVSGGPESQPPPSHPAPPLLSRSQPGPPRPAQRQHAEPAAAVPAAVPAAAATAGAEGPAPATNTGSVVIAERVAARPVPAEPVPAEPAPAEPAPAEPVAVESATAEPTAAESTTAEPAAGPTSGPVVTSEPAGEPRAVEPATPGPAAAERAVSEQVTGPVRLEPVHGAAPRPTPTPRAGDAAKARRSGAAAVWILPEAVGTTTAKSEPRNDAVSTPSADGTDAPSRPLSDPDLTPLMGIPIVRPQAAEVPVPPPVRPPVPPPVPPVPADDVTAPRPAPGVPPVTRVPFDDEVVSMSPTPGSAPAPVVRTGSPQPVWFRVVRRDGEPVGAVVVALLDDHGQEVDTTKTATDGGGELRTPHGGRFLMIASADGFQPRAVMLTVEEQPVELALLLPRSASVAGAVRSEGRPVTGARVVVRQEGEIVDDLVTGRDGAYRFNDLAEGGYVLSATDYRGSVVRQVRMSEGADLQVDLDLVYREGAR
jgi:hypothetical protein